MSFKFHHSVLLFALFLVLFVSYLVSTNIAPPTPSYLFWIAVIFLAFLLVWQIGRADSGRYQLIVLSEILLFGFALHLIYVLPVPYGIFNYDSHHHYSAARLILDSGWPLSNIGDVTQHTIDYSDWPGMHILGGAISLISGMDLFTIEGSFTVTRWIPSILGSLTVLPIFIFSKSLYQNAKVGLLAAVGFTALFHPLANHSTFTSETLAFPLLFFVLYFCVVYITDFKNRQKITFLLVLVLAALVLSHHLTLFILIACLAILVVTLLLFGMTNRGSRDLRVSIGSSTWWLMSVAIVAVVSFLLYLMYVGERFFYILILSFKFLGQSSSLGASSIAWERHLREYAIFDLRIFFAAIFIILLLWQIRKNKDDTIVGDIFCFGVGGFFFVWVTWGTFATPESPGFMGVTRGEGFAWTFILIAAAHAIFQSRYKGVLKYLVSALILFNLFLISPYIYDHSARPTYTSDEISNSNSLALYKAAEWFDSRGRVIGDLAVEEVFGGLKQANITVDALVFEGDLTEISKYDWLIIRSEDFKLVKTSGAVSRSLPYLSSEVYADFNSSPQLMLAYSSADTWIYRIKH